MTKFVLVGCAIVLSAGDALADVPPPAPSSSVINSMRLETRLIVRSYGGNLPVIGGSSSLTTITPATYPNGIPAGTLLRFEIQYRITDLVPNDRYKPGGINAAAFNVTTNIPVGTQSGAFAPANLQTTGALSGLYGAGANPGFRAALTTNTQNTPGLDTTVDPDTSGFSSVRGIFEPYRESFTGAPQTLPNGGFFGNQPLPPSQTDPFVISYNPSGNLGIYQVLPLRIAATGVDSGVYQGVYAFDFAPATDQTEPWVFTVNEANAVIAILGTYTNNEGEPSVSNFGGLFPTNTIPTSSITFSVPGPGSVAVLGLGVAVAARRRRDAA